MEQGKKIFFISDLHLGAPNQAKSLERERLFVQWLEEYAPQMQELYIVGDLFDFWFEYKKAVPRGYVRSLGALAHLADKGLPIHLFTGNHDMWIFDYMPSEIGLKLYREPIIKEYHGKRFYIGHGDGLGPGDHGYKFIKKVFANKLCQWAFARLHPNFGIGLADFFSKKSRAKTGDSDAVYKGKEQEWLYTHCKEVLENQSIDYFIFGHRHLPLELDVEGKAKYVNLGDWIQYYTYATWDGKELQGHVYKSDAKFIRE